jgi:hypothetical protein
VLAVRIALLASNGGGGGNTVAVPHVANLSEADAASRLQQAGLKPVSTPQNDPTVKVGNAIGTDPPEGTKVKKNSDVKLFVSTGPTTSTTFRRTTTQPTATVPVTTTPATTEPFTTPTTSSTPTTTRSATTLSVP